jgi:hypothetical protein
MQEDDKKRDRSSGWKHAKKDGHAYEDQFADQVMEDQDLYGKLRDVAGLGGGTFPVRSGS